MNVKLLLSAVGLFFCSCLQADITAVSGTFEDGATVTVQGGGFGQHNMNIAFIGSKNGGVQKTSPGGLFPNHQGGWSYGGDAVMADLYVHNGQHSRVPGNSVLVGRTTSAAPWNAPLVYDMGTPVPPQTWIYFTYWAKMDSPTSSGQWKMWRLSNRNQISDHKGELNYYNWNSQQMLTSHTEIAGFSNPTFWLGGGINEYPTHGRGAWTRLEVAVKTSNYNVADGNAEVWLHDRSFSKVPRIAPINNKVGNEKVYDAASDQFRYLILQNYFGNGYNSADVYMEDVYVQVGGKKRVEICESANWNQCAHREIQYPTKWAANEIEFELNIGSFSSGDTVYVHVLDDNGQSAGGAKVVLGGNAVVKSAPLPPSGFLVQKVSS